MDDVIAKAQKWWWLAVTVPVMFTTIGTAYITWDKINNLVELAFMEDEYGMTGVEWFTVLKEDYITRKEAE